MKKVMMMNEEAKQVAVVMVPFQAQGHLNQLLQLSCLISSSYGLPVYYVGLATCNHQVKLRANALNPSDIAKIHFHDLPTPPSFCETTHPTAPTPKSNIPIHVQPIWTAYSMLLRDPITSFFQLISSKSRRVVVIHDPLMSYNVQDISSFPNMESYMLTCISCFDIYCSFISPITGMPIPLGEEVIKRIPSLEGCYTHEITHLKNLQSRYMGTKAGDIHNASRIIEGSTFIDLLEKLAASQNKKQWAIGPFLPASKPTVDDTSNDCLEWLKKQAPNSVLYVSFGTSTVFSNEQIKELAVGLEMSKQKFIWVLRDADKGDSQSTSTLELPEGFEGRVEGVGLVVRQWAPQPEILGHSATGGFMSHCGWNSCIESITMGVPIAAWPMHSDQPKNGFLVTELLKIGLPVREWVKREELVTSSTIHNVVRRLMASEEGDAIRKRAQELGEAVRRSTEEGGAARIELDSFIAHITR